MLRLRIMPLVVDFGELLDHPLGTISPKTSLVFSRDYRIFGQFQHFPDMASCGEDVPQKSSIKPLPLPLGMMLVECEEEGEKEMQVDGLGVKIGFAHAKQLKTLVISEDASAINKAIKAYIDALPDDIPIILAWE
jgi:hypothetical protein